MGHAQSHGHRIGCMAGYKSIVRTFIGLWKAGKTAQLPQSTEKRLTTGEDLMRVALMPHIKDQPVLSGIKHPVDGHRKLHHTQVGGQMPTGLGNALDEKRAKLPAKLLHLFIIQIFYVLRIMDLF